MKAIILREIGGPEKLQLESVADPLPGPGEAAVRLRAAALNHRDVWIRKGQYAGIKLPIILGSDGAGSVSAVGPGGDASFVGKSVVINPGFEWGDDERVQGANFRILGLPDDGTYAEFIKVPTAQLHEMPAAWSFTEAATLPLAGLTAYRAVVTKARVKRGETVLITGIGGGVSQFALPIARSLGATVFVTSGSDEKIDRASAAGAAGGVNYHATDWIKGLRSLTHGGPDAIIDSVGGPMLNDLIDLVKPGGRIVTYGATAGVTPNFEVRRAFWKQVQLLGTTMGSPTEFAAMLKLFADSDLRPVVDRVFPLAEAGAAQRRMEEARQYGKIVLEIA